MTASEDIMNLPSNEPQLKKYTLIVLLVCLCTCIAMIVWFYIRFNQSGENNYEISALWSLVHIGGYIALTVFSCIGLYGAYFQKSQLLLWFIFACLVAIITEIVCIVYNQLLGKEVHRYSIFVVIFKILAIVVFATSAVFAFLWKRFIDNRALDVQKEVELKTGNTEGELAAAKSTPVADAKKIGSKVGSKAGARSKAGAKA